MPSWMGIFKIFECNMQNKNDFTLPYPISFSSSNE